MLGMGDGGLVAQGRESRFVLLCVVLAGGMACSKPDVYEDLYVQAEYGKIREMAQMRLGENPNDFESHLYLSRSLSRLGDTRQALVELGLALRAVPGSLNSQYRLAIVASELGDRAILVSCFDRLRMSDPKLALELMNRPDVSSVLVPKTSHVVHVETGPGRLHRKRKAMRTMPVFEEGEVLIEVIQDPDGRPVSFRCLSGTKKMFGSIIFDTVQDTFKSPSSVSGGQFVSWHEKTTIKKAFSMEVVTTGQ